MIANKLTPTEIKPQDLNQGLVMDNGNEDINIKKRKRKSRWANDNVKVSLASPICVLPPVAIEQAIPQPVNTHQLGNVLHV